MTQRFILKWLIGFALAAGLTAGSAWAGAYEDFFRAIDIDNEAGVREPVSLYTSPSPRD